MIPIARPFIGLRERREVARVLRSAQLSQGSEVESFEEEFSKSLVGGAPVVAVNSGTSALHLSLVALGIGPGDEVVVPAFSFAATANVVAIVGAKPVFCDVDPDTFCLDVRKLREVLTPRTRAVIPVHLYGHPADVVELAKLAVDFGFALIEDAAQAHGASIWGKPVGTFGTASAFSLYPTKNMTSGEGGMVSCGDDVVSRRLRSLRNQGMINKYVFEEIGLNNRMSDIHAAIGRVQLRRLSRWTERRRSNAFYYLKHLEGVSLPKEVEGYRHVYHQFTIKVPEDRAGFAKALSREFGVQSAVYYPQALNVLRSMSGFGQADSCPVSIELSQSVLSIPVHPFLKDWHLHRVVRAINQLVRAGG